uniref:Uncharacterized protein n=1 Tax=Arundo donax TaxID=35708 RepID=A0A0A9GJM7_ARUDO
MLRRMRKTGMRRRCWSRRRQLCPRTGR